LQSMRQTIAALREENAQLKKRLEVERDAE